MRSALLDRFEESLTMNFDRWHDGEGYALDLLDEATPEEFAQIEGLLLSRSPRDWRDIEALVRLDTPASRERLRGAWDQGDFDLRLAIASHARGSFDEAEIAEVLVTALRERGIGDGLVGTMLVVEEFHPPAVVEALLEGARGREGAVAYDCASMLLFLHGQIGSVHDLEERPFLVQFLEEDRSAAFRELCARIGVEAPPP